MAQIPMQQTDMIGVGTLITSDTSGIPSINYQATQDCWVHYMIIRGSNAPAASTKVYINGNQVDVLYFSGAVNMYSGGLVPLKKGQTLTSDSLTGVTYAYWAYSIV